ncbi:hypothetical protein [Virgibacillus ihumii]|uniref:hypothetical protein n=1 Tax=Virgibacillus ihumii TaxID=2686091 RepID=UPI00157CFDFA|nr:hypothetical protein [Virgibacillus ihumii]
MINEIHEPYYALLKAENKGIARQKYIEYIADDAEGTVVHDLYEIHRDKVIIKHSRSLNEDGEPLPIDELLDEIKDDNADVLLVDGSLF